jgi:Flp pilus assembly pilin Flp
MIALITCLRRLRRAESGVAMTEFALAMPFILGVGLVGIETAHRTLVQMQISQIATQVADNASRIGELTILQDTKIYEEQINDLLHGADLQAGPGLKLYEHGRVVVSSLEVWQPSVHSNGNATPQADGVQFIHWQRCAGALARDSLFGNQNSAVVDGMGPEGQEVLASTDTPVMFVEVFYDYQPIIAFDMFGEDEVYATAAFVVRHNRDQSEVFKRNVLTQPSDCTNT